MDGPGAAYYCTLPASCIRPAAALQTHRSEATAVHLLSLKARALSLHGMRVPASVLAKVHVGLVSAGHFMGPCCRY